MFESLQPGDWQRRGLAQRSWPFRWECCCTNLVTSWLTGLHHDFLNVSPRFQGVALHYASATHSVERTFWQLVYTGKVGAAASLLPLWKVGLATTAGIVFTYLVTIDCCIFAARKSPHPLVIALGVFAPVRFLSGLPTMFAALSGKRISAGTDEAHLAALTGIPVLLLNFMGLLVLVFAWIWLVRRIPKDHRWVSFGSLIAGLALGMFLYFGVIGPRLLP